LLTPVKSKEEILFLDRFEWLEKIGSGSFGEVHRVKDKKSGLSRAIKMIFFDKNLSL